MAAAGNVPQPIQGSLAAIEALGLARGRRLAVLGPASEPATGSMLALAFRDNPINRAVIDRGRKRRVKVNTYGMVASLVASRSNSFRRLVLEHSSPRRDQLRGKIAAALVALDPGGYPVASPPIAIQLRCLFGQGPRIIRRWAELYNLLDRYHPKEPHCYLALIATHPARQHRGIGRALLDAWLQDVDARAMPSYLESDRPELIGFYRAAGFEVEQKLEAFGKPIWCMKRPARTNLSHR